MKLEKWDEPRTRDMVYRLTISHRDLCKMRPLSEFERYALDHFKRDDASIEERLMALQIIARAVEESRDAVRALEG